MKRPFFPLFFFCCMFALFIACGEENSASTEETEQGTTISDDAETEFSRNIESAAPELIGTWKLTNQRIGDLFISPSEIDEPVREFTAQGNMILRTNTSAPQTIQYTYLDGIISTLQEGDQYVKYLSADSLMLTETVDGVEAEYVFVKIR